MENKNIFIYAEGRGTVKYIPDSMKHGAENCGWGFKRLWSFKLGDLMDEEKAEELFPANSGIILRNLCENDEAEVMALAYWLNDNGRVSLNFNAVGGLTPSNDKQFQQTLLLNDARTKNFVSPAYSVEGPEDVLKLVKKGRLKYPLLLKPRDGSLGKGIVAIFKKEDLMEQKRWKMMAAQQYIESDYDWRVYIVGGAPIGAVRRGGKEGKEFDFSAQATGIDLSGEDDPVVFDEISKIAACAAAVTGLEFGGIDIICDRKTGKYYILESNTSPTWGEAYNRSMKTDVATEITRWMNDRLQAKKKSKHDAMKSYVEKRLNKLSKRTQKRYESIMNGTERKIANKGNDLPARLHRCYNQLFSKGNNLAECKCLIDEVEGRPYCWAGNFIGSATWGEDGVLEDGCIPTAYYLAIKEKYDIMAQVKSKE